MKKERNYFCPNIFDNKIFKTKWQLTSVNSANTGFICTFVTNHLFMTKITFLFYTLAALCVTTTSYAQKEYKINIEVAGLSDSTAYLAYYYGKGQYYRDTTQIDKNGKLVFEGKDSLIHGMYSLIVGDRRLFDFMVGNQEFSMQTDTSFTILNMKVDGSNESQIFYEYLQFLNERQGTAKKLNEKKKNGTAT